MSAPISFHGALFQEGTNVTPAIAKAANVAKTYGLGLVKARTPVDTSLLKSSWQAKLENNGIRYINDAPYAGFVENGTSRMAGRHMLGDSLTDIETIFYQELSREIGKAMAFDLIDVSANPSYKNAVKSDYPGTGTDVKPVAKGKGLNRKPYSKKYLFPNPRDIVPTAQKKQVNAARPRFQKNERPFVPEFKVSKQK